MTDEMWLLNDLSAGVCVPLQGDNQPREVKEGLCLAVHTAYHLNPLKLLMCYMITSTACQSQR